MNFTNKNKFSDEVIKWLLIDEYDYEPGVLSATTLMDPIRKTILKERHREEMEVDVEAFIDRRFGTAVHSSFEKIDYSDREIIQEKRYHADVGEYRISGKPDMLVPLNKSDLYLIRDIKTASVWAAVYGDKIDDWALQLSIYKYILTQNGIKTLDYAKMIAFYKDWSRKGAEGGGKYPKCKLQEPKIQLLSMEDTEDYIRNQLQEIAIAKELPDDDLPLCTEKELWFKPGNDAYMQDRGNGKYAHMREGSTRALKVYDDREMCQAAVDQDCLGTVVRCPQYCSVHPFCNQHKEMKEKGLIKEDTNGGGA